MSTEPYPILRWLALGASIFHCPGEREGVALLAERDALAARADRAEALAADLEAKVFELQDRLAAERAEHARERRMGEIQSNAERRVQNAE